MNAATWIQLQLGHQATTPEQLELNYKLSELVDRSSRETLAVVIEAYVADKANDFGDPDYSR